MRQKEDSHIAQIGDHVVCIFQRQNCVSRVVPATIMVTFIIVQRHLKRDLIKGPSRRAFPFPFPLPNPTDLIVSIFTCSSREK